MSVLMMIGPEGLASGARRPAPRNRGLALGAA